MRALPTATLLQAQIDSETDVLADLDHLLQVRPCDCRRGFAVAFDHALVVSRHHARADCGG
ncbi:hypothetical protein, partial [Vibrio cholerae]|uniref:hypothetical protein n=1 Tax=Vibrio cholerae TaxID=666 RepID=UPI001F42CA6F